MKYGAIIVAAGCSSRMGSFKPLLPLGTNTIIRRVVRLIDTVADEIVVVTGYRGEDLECHLHGTGVRAVRNVKYRETGMFDSICLGIRALSRSCQRIFIIPGDIPLVRPKTLEKLRETSAAVVRPLCHGKSGHPILLSSGCIIPLLSDSGEGGLRGAITRMNLPVLDVETGDPGILMDADTPEDYQRLVAYLDSLPADFNRVEALSHSRKVAY